MGKLYPPYIEGTIPAFYVNGLVANLAIPFSMNKAVSMADFSGIAIKIKTVQSNEYIYSATTDANEIDYIKANLCANFNITLQDYPKLKPGQYYKVQIAYCDTTPNRVPGYYSTVGVVKFTTFPSVTIADLVDRGTSRIYYTGVYRQYSDNEDTFMDVSEKVYEYCFNLYEINDNSESFLVSTSDWQLHDSSTDVLSYESTDTYCFDYSLKPNHYYQVEYVVKTINGLQCSSGKYTIMDKVGIAPEINATFTYDLNFDNGYIDLKLVPNNYEHNFANGAFILLRASEDDDFTNWYELKRFSLRNADRLDEWSFRDFTVQHGKKYCYAIQQYNSKGLHSTKMYATKNNNKYVTADFEDCFLYDGKRQLKIRFNPKVTSFKTDVMENKIETIGSKYPFIFRNSKVEYKEFPLSGLISYHSDEDNLFMKDEDLGLTTNYTSKPRSIISRTKATNVDELYLKPRTTSLETYNIAAERIFKMEVLDWLNNGQPKLFRSPTEGNFFIRLMGVSLTPEEKTGRMIHSFQATAYEIDDCSYNTLNKYGIIEITEPQELQYRLKTIDISTPEAKSYYENSGWGQERIAAATAEAQENMVNAQYELGLSVTNKDNAYSLYLRSKGTPDEQYYFSLLEEAYEEINEKDSQVREAQERLIYLQSLVSYKKYNNDTIFEYIEFRDCLPGTTFYIFDKTTNTEFSIVIGVTGTYVVNIENHEFTSIRVSEEETLPPFGLITYKYLAVVENNFEKVYDVDFEQVYARQFIGMHNGTVIINTAAESDEINDIKRTLLSFYYTNFTAKEVYVIHDESINGIMTYWQWDENADNYNAAKGNAISFDALSPLNIYKVYHDISNYEYAMLEYNINTHSYEFKAIDNIDYHIYIDDTVLELQPHHEEELLNHLIQFFNDQAFTYLKIGNGIIVDCAYTTSVVTYNVELSDVELTHKMLDYVVIKELYNSPNSEYYQSPAVYLELVNQWRTYCNILKTKL